MTRRHALAAWAALFAVAAVGSAWSGPAENELSLPGGPVFHVTPHTVTDLRTLEVPGTDGVAVLWTELLPEGGAEHYYAISLDGQNFSRAFPTTNRIELRYASFDPLADVPEVPAELAADANNRMFIVQFHVQPLEAYQDILTALGVTIHAFLPEHAVMAELPAGTQDVVAQLPFVRWVGPLHPAYKLDESILAALQSGADFDSYQNYSVMVFGRGMESQNAVIDLIKTMGGDVMTTAPDGFRMTVTLTLPQVLAVARLSEVHFIDPWGPGETDMDIVRQIGGVNDMYALGFKGQGVRGEVFDTGVANHQEWNGRPVLWHKTSATDSHGTACYGVNFAWGVVAQARGINPEREEGVAFYYNNSTQFGGSYTRLAMNQEATDPNGQFRSMYQTSSVGSPRTFTYTTISAETDDYLFKVDYLSCQSQSNADLNQDSRPQAWAKNILSVGGITHNNTLSRTDDYSSGSTGPASDNRIKPDLAHFYDSVYTTYSTSFSGYGEFGGTSNATPCTCGHTGLMMQLWHEGVFEGHGGGPSAFADRPKSTTAKAIMINTAYRYNWKAGGSNANMYRDRQGWGMADLAKLYANRAKMIIIDETDVLRPLDVKEYKVNVPQGEPEFAVSMVYIDPQGNPANQTQHRINDLTLKVISPSNVVYWGNNGLRDDNFSTPGGNPNTKDTVENVFLFNPEPGVWTVQVRGDEIVQDARLETPELDADYGLVIRGVLPCSSAGVIFLNAGGYSCSSVATIQVIDCDLNQNPNQVETVQITIDSTSEPAGEPVILTETGPGTAAFQGSIPLSATNAPGVLWVAHGDLVTATYIDADNGQGGYNVVVTATATVDCQAPQIANVQSTVSPNTATITFNSNEPVLATVYYGTTCGQLTQQVSTTQYATSPVIQLTGLTPTTRYYFAVEAKDKVANTTYDNNGGQCYTFRTLVGPGPVYTVNMDTDPGWSISGGQWAWGQPTGQGGAYGGPDPTSGYTGQNVYGYNLNGDYGNSIPEYHLTSTPFDCTNVSQTKLRFWRWLGVERFTYDKAYVRVSNNGTTWTNVWQNPDAETADRTWVFQEFDISAVADGQATVYLRWTMGPTDTSWTYCGWNIDDVVIWGIVPEPYLPGDLNCDGNVDFGDINPFVLALTNPAGYAAKYPNCNIMLADINGDGRVDFGDINPFVRLLTGP